MSDEIAEVVAEEPALPEISASDLGLGHEEIKEEVEEIPEHSEVAEIPVEDKPAPVQTRAAPKSWQKDFHEPWGKIDPKTQEYIELREKQMLDGLEQYKGDSGFGKQMREVITPYKAMLQAQGVDEPRAVQYLLNAHYKLTNSSPEEKKAYFSTLAKNYGITLEGMAEQVEIDPAIKELRDNFSSLRDSLTAREQAAQDAARANVAKDVEAFALDEKHPYFDEVADDIVAMIKAGKNLEDAYEKAVWANPVTRQKEMARLQTESQSQLQAKAKAEADKARKAAGVNVNSRDTRRTPTEPKGTMEDTMRSTLKEIRGRTH